MSATTIRDFGVPVNSPEAASFARTYPPGFGPGDVWEIGGKPYDPQDPGPWRPDPDYVPDPRTGRHRRGELPDPHPDAEAAAAIPEPYGRPTPRPRRGYRDWHDPEPDSERNSDPDAALREGAWDRFITESEELHQAHYTDNSLDLRRFERMWWLLQWAFYVLTCCTTTEPKPLGQRETAPIPAPTVVGSAVVQAPEASLRTSPREARTRHTQANDMTFILQWESSFDTGPMMLGGAL